jgi:hypothetical protein
MCSPETLHSFFNYYSTHSIRLLNFGTISGTIGDDQMEKFIARNADHLQGK